MVISGGTGSGKTTLMNALSAFIPHDERVATIEDAAELRLQQPHVVRMETRPANIEGNGAIMTRDLVKNALRMRPDRIIVGECRGRRDPRHAPGHEHRPRRVDDHHPRQRHPRRHRPDGDDGRHGRLRPADLDHPPPDRLAVQLIVQAARLSGGVRKIIKISEIVGMEEDVVSMQDIFVFKQTGVDEDRVAQGYFYCTGIRPKCMEALESAGSEAADRAVRAADAERQPPGETGTMSPTRWSSGLVAVTAMTGVIAISQILSDLFLRDRSKVNDRVDFEFLKNQRSKTKKIPLFKNLSQIAADAAPRSRAGRRWASRSFR